MATVDVATGLVALCRTGNYAEAVEKYYADDIVSVEANGDMPDAHGKEACRGKLKHWTENMEVHSTAVEGPYVNGDHFVVIFEMDVTDKSNGSRMKGKEAGVYTVKDDKVVHERFFDAPR